LLRRQLGQQPEIVLSARKRSSDQVRTGRSDAF
jgi:hypothetical protein